MAVVAKLSSASAASAAAGLPRAEALTVGALMNARAFRELVVLAVGVEAGLVDGRLVAVPVLVALVTRLATGALIDADARTPRAAAPGRGATRCRGCRAEPPQRSAPSRIRAMIASRRRRASSRSVWA